MIKSEPEVNRVTCDVTSISMKQPTLLDLCVPPPPKRQRLNDHETDCVREISCFVQFGDYAMELLPKVIDNIWRHYGIDNDSDKQRIMRAAGAYVGPRGALQIV